MQTFLRAKYFLLLSALLLVISCKKEGTDSVVTKTLDDSLMVNVGVYPSTDVLPLMIANDMGILDSLGVSAKFLIYRSQMDAEKALVEGKVDVAMSDMFRVAWWQWQKKPVRFAFVTRRKMYVVANKALRISNINQLDDRMVAISRFSLDDYYCDKVDQLVKPKKGQILRPQINSVELRVKMLTSGQLDAAVLPQLQTFKAELQGYKAINDKTGVMDGFAGFAYNVNSLQVKEKRKQIRQLHIAYNIVVNKLAKSPAMPEISQSTQQALFLNQKTIGKINPQKDFARTQTPNFVFVDESVSWLKKYGAVGNNFSGDTLVVE